MATPRKSSKKPGHEEREHAPLPPSASSRWLRCRPSQGYIRRLISLKRIKKRESGPAAQRGTRIHEIAEPWLRASIAEKRFKVSTKFKPKGAKDEIAEAKDYVTYCMRRWEQACELDPKATCGVETRSTVTAENWGSVDFWILAARRLTSIDLKSGREGVEAFNNTQLINYLYGIAKPLPQWPREFECVIWQPNAMDGPAERSYVYDATEFGKRVDYHMEGVEEATGWLDHTDLEKVEAALTAGDHCEWCDALGVCPKARERQMAISSKSFEPVTVEKFQPPAANILEADQVAEIMKRLPAFEAWVEAVKVRALELMHKGQRVPGFKVVQKITRRAWEQKYTDAQIARGVGVNIKEMTKTIRLSPAQVEELLDKAGKDRLKRFVFKPEGDPVVVAESDRRVPLLATKISFNPVSREEDSDG